MVVVKEISPDALGITAIELAHGIMRHLVAQNLMSEDDVEHLLATAAKRQRSLGEVLPTNEEAATLLEGMAEDLNGKWR